MTLVRVTDRDDDVAGFDTRPMLLSRDMNPTRWIPPLESAVLEANEVHVWKASLHASPSRLAALRDALSPEEHLRSQIYRFQEDRQRFVVARGLLRTILARYLHANPGELCFAVSQTGKPELHPDLNSRTRFSLSYSGDRAVFALTQALRCWGGHRTSPCRLPGGLCCRVVLLRSRTGQVQVTSRVSAAPRFFRLLVPQGSNGKSSRIRPPAWSGPARSFYGSLGNRCDRCRRAIWP